MAEYTNAELLNEVAKIFRARITPKREGGTLNTRDEYAQLLELASITFLFDSNAIFHLGRQAANILNSFVNQEVALIEDILVSLDDLDQLGKSVVDTATLSNAKTAVLALDAASTISGRPEAAQFDRQMDAFAEHFRLNVVSRRTGNLVRPREDARNLIKKNLERLKTLHESLLDSVFGLRDMLQEFVGLNIPSKASASALKSIRDRLDQTISEMEEYSPSDNVAASRQWLLRTLANKIGVQLVSDFTDPRELKYRSPIRPIPPTLTHLGRATGEGTPASVTSGEGPWSYPFEPVDLVLRVDDELDITVPLSGLVGSSIEGTNRETFEIDASADRLIVTVDPVYRSVLASGTHNSQQVDVSGIRLGYKHLGAPLYFPTGHGWDSYLNPQNQRPRIITGLGWQQTFSNGTYFPATRKVVFLVGGVIVEEDVGGYLEDDSGNYWEIVEYLGPKTVRIAVPEGIPSPDFHGAGSYRLASHRYLVGPNRIYFTPNLVGGEVPQNGGTVGVGPTVKHVTLSSGSGQTAADVISDASDVSNGKAAVHYHARVQTAYGDPARLSISPRSTADPYLRISSSILVPDPTAGADPVLYQDSVHGALGFNVEEALDPQYEVNDFLSAEELANAINSAGEGYVTAEVLTTAVLSGETGKVVKGSTSFDDDAVPDWTVVGVKVRDQISLENGPYARAYQIVGVTAGAIILKTRQGVTFDVEAQNISYSIERKQVKVSTVSAVRGTSLQVTGAPREMEFSTDIKYAAIPGFEAMTGKGEFLDFRRASVGDFLKLVGSSDEYEVTAVSGARLTLDPGLPSNTVDKGFELKSAAARSYAVMQERLQTFTSSRNLLKKHKFDENLDAVDRALTSALLHGGNFAASRNQARSVLTTLLSLLTSDPKRTEEYSASVLEAADNLQSIIAVYSAPSSPSIDSFVDALRERKYTRAADLLTSGRVADFYATNEETGSYSGAILSAARAVVNDLPSAPSTQDGVSNEKHTAYALDRLTDADEDFSDTDQEYEVDA